MSSLIMAQTTTNLPITEDLEEAARRQVRLAAEAIASFDAHASDGQESTISYDSLASVEATYLSDIDANLLANIETFDMALCVWRMIMALSWSVGLGATLFGVLPSM